MLPSTSLDLATTFAVALLPFKLFVYKDKSRSYLLASLTISTDKAHLLTISSVTTTGSSQFKST